jgi:L-phenylalanine/L-methionine N-acetyltransferase
MESTTMQRVECQIRRAEPDDYLSIYEIFCSPSAYAGTLQLPFPSRDQWREQLAHPGDGVYGLVSVVEDRVVGMISLHTNPHKPRRQHAGFLGMGVHEQWQGQGIGSALMTAAIDLADNWLDLSRLELEVYSDNERAIRLYERHGFEREGLLRQFAYRNGQFVDALYMARLRRRA